MNAEESASGESIRVRGLVQGVGFRPFVWRLARELGLDGDVRNDGEGVLIRVFAAPGKVDALCGRLLAGCPPLARIDTLERSAVTGVPAAGGFAILASEATAVRTGIVPDAATCPACRAEIADPKDRRYRYPFANCTHCGPRLSILRAIPYDRANTSMAAFPLCERCRGEYEDPANRRFHAQPIACRDCGPTAWLAAADGRRLAPPPWGADDPVATASRLLATGAILAIKGIGGFHLACDACNAAAVGELRRRKRRRRKPFALMARDIEVVRRYCRVGATEAALLADPAAPVLLLEARGPDQAPPGVAPEVAPGQSTLGFMLPYSPLHHLLLADWDRPLVMTSGNPSGQPQCVDNEDACARLAGIADAFLLHDRTIVNRVDDSVVRIMDGTPRLLRRARGHAPAPLRLPAGLGGDSARVLALGGELKNTLCLLAGGRAILSQHLGDLADAKTALAYAETIALYRALFRHDPEVLAVDLHPDYRSSRYGRAWADRTGLKLVAVQHHFAHIGSVLADNAWPLDAGRVLGIALDGLGYGDDGSVWGGELLLADYLGYERVGCLKPVPLPGGAKAVLEPWRNAFAHLATHLGWEAVAARYPELDLVRYLGSKPLAVLATMMDRGLNSPRSSSCGRLFDAVAAAVGLCREGLTYEGEAAIELEALAVRAPAQDQGPAGGGYPLGIVREGALLVLDPTPLWWALLDDLARGVVRERIAARFHNGLARALVGIATELAQAHGIDTLALSGGVFQNKTLLEAVGAGLRAAGLRVLGHRQVPANDGGLALGQAVIAAVQDGATD